jgi:predicted ATP-grasp superfamily ATP-dependent carboligase
MAGIEFKFDIHDKTWKLLDVNSRMTGSVQHAIGCGIDLPWIYYCDMTGKKILQDLSYEPGIKHTKLQLDISSLLHYRRAKEITFRQWLSSYRGRLVHQVFAWDDLWPLFFTYRKSLISSIRNRIRR